jgi:hypothetical protein
VLDQPTACGRSGITAAFFAGAILGMLGVSVSVDAHDPIGRVTWAGDIAPVIQARCVPCHGAGQADPMPLTTYEEAQPWVSAIRQQVLSRKMPIWHAARGFGEFANDPSLSPLEISLIAAWANAGGPRGEYKARDSSAQSEPQIPVGDPPPHKTRALTLACGSQPLSGRLLAVNPQLEKGGSATITARLPDGQAEIIAWIRDYDPRYPTVYWLRRPLVLPRGGRLETAPTGECSMTVTLAR